jgi:hypothetical protein
VGGSLGRHAKSGAVRVSDRCRDFLRVGGQRDRRRMLVEQEVEGRAGVVPAGVAGAQDGADERVVRREVRFDEHAARVRERRPAVDPADAG